MQRTAVVNQAGEQRSARVESLRALAALGVVAGHVFGVSHAFAPSLYGSYGNRVILGGGFGVYLFFALTGDLLFWPFVKQGFSGSSVDLRSYARNRVLRILPLYYAVVITLLIVQEHGGSAGQWWRFLTLSENFSHSTIRTVDGVVWSLVIEAQFYVLLPLLAWLTLRIARGSLARGAAVVALLGAASLALRLHFVTLASSPDPLLQYSLPTTFFFFTAGMLVAQARLALEGSRLPGPLARADAWLLCALPLWAFVFYRYPWEPLCALASALMVAACVLPLRPGRLVRALEWKPLAAIGIVSYSLYMWHFPIVAHLGRGSALSGHTLLSFGLLVPLSLAAAFASYALIEAPFLRLRRRWAPSAAPQRAPAVDLAVAVPAPAEPVSAGIAASD
ncbi:MAG TPA: acyltransferase [Thermoleophilaceae bacterium]|nr:acyltransferase [Thermoleophilaceae bacterium]